MDDPAAATVATSLLSELEPVDSYSLDGMVYRRKKRFAECGYSLVDVGELIDRDRRSFLIGYAHLQAQRVQKRGRGPGSLEPEETAGLDYRVVTGEKIAHGVPWFYQTARKTLAELVSLELGWPCWLSPDEQSAININWVSGEGGRYELHTDSAHTALLFLTTLSPEDGGALHVEPPGFPPAEITPQAGWLAIFDGSVTPHAVQPLARPGLERFSIPIAYASERVAERPELLSGYLYQPATV